MINGVKNSNTQLMILYILQFLIYKFSESLLHD